LDNDTEMNVRLDII